MIHIALQTEFSFKKCYHHIKDVHKQVVDGVVGIADLNNTFGHIPLMKQAEKHGFKPIYGVRLHVIKDGSKQRTCGTSWVFIAKNSKGFKEMNELVAKAYDQFYYFPRLFYTDMKKVSDNVFIIANDSIPMVNDYDFIAIGQGQRNMPADKDRNELVSIDSNNYSTLADRDTYQLLAGARKNGDDYNNLFDAETFPQHILSEDEWKAEYGTKGHFNTKHIADLCNVEIPKAELVRWKGNHDMKKVMDFSKVADWTDEYQQRLDREVNLIIKKGYTDYFLITADLIEHAKRKMLVGPARGSSAGSLVCYLMGITEVDPIEHDLIFERFIDENRFDYPDIDVDFPDIKRESLVKYLKHKYGSDKVMCLANVNRLKAKSAIGEFAKSLSIPAYETTAVKDAIIERSSGDARAAMCIMDTFETTEAGKEFIEKYPAMLLVEDIEGHASHAGKHAAGILVSTEPLSTYGSLNTRDDIIQMDKKDAEYIGLLKVDCLGLRTLSILESVAEQIGKPYDWFYTLPLTDSNTYAMLNSLRLNGIFQFEGQALQIIVKQMGVNDFNDISAITALARPGALNSGGTARYIKYSTGEEEPKYYSDVHKEITGDTYGIVIYQEQMMELARKCGGLTWADTQTLRKASSKSMGDEFFGKFKDKFVKGALENGYDNEQADQLWVDISASGSWTFNKSHAVSYGLISYWTAYCKANYPGEFAVASLNHAADSSHAIKLLRDLVQHEGFTYTPVDSDNSGLNWTQHDGKLVGGLLNIKGIGVAKARQIIKARDGKGAWTPSLMKTLMNPKTEFDVLFPAQHYFGFLYDDPAKAGLDTKPNHITDIDGRGDYVFIGKLVDRNIRDLNEQVFLERRNGERIEDNTLYINFKLEDDTDMVSCKIDRYKYEAIGRPIAEGGKLDKSWYLVRGKIKGDWRTVDVTEIVNLNEYYNINP